MRRLPPSSPLLPYTTLFRSVAAAAYTHFASAANQTRFVMLRDRLRSPDALPPPDRKQVVEEMKMLVDRKSSRLNSRHSQISYAAYRLTKNTSIAYWTRGTAA